MPLDGRNWKPETETKPDLSKPSLEGLSWLLRHMPADHEWDFEHVGGRRANGCGSAGCALGLAIATWAGKGIAFSNVPMAVMDKIFMYNQYLPVADRNVTPLMVADRIDAYLAETCK